MAFEKFLTLERPINGGIQKLYRFENNLGASVVQHNFSYGGDNGQWELGVTKYEGGDWALNYNTPVTDDVLGYLDWDEVETNLRKISKLEKGVY